MLGKKEQFVMIMSGLVLTACDNNNGQIPPRLSEHENYVSGQLVDIVERMDSNRKDQHYYYMIDTDGNTETIEYTGELLLLSCDGPASQIAKVKNDKYHKPKKALFEWARELHALRRVR